MNNMDNVMNEFNKAMSKSTKRIYAIEVSSKISGKHALYFMFVLFVWLTLLYMHRII